MMWWALLFLCEARFMLLEKLTLSPALSIISENTSLELICNAHMNTSYTQWGTLDRSKIFSYLTFSKGEACTIDGFLSDTKHFDTKCYGNGTFKVRIKHVNLSNHGQDWYCSDSYTKSNSANIDVQVPTKYVKIKNVSGDIIATVERIKTTLICETSEGRPAANISWIKVSQTNVKTDITNNETYNVSIREILSENNMTIVQSRIDIVPFREDNGTRIKCQSSNTEYTIVKKEVMLEVQYPPSEPILYVNERKVTGNMNLILRKNVSVVCRSDSFPYPTYIWISGSSKYVGQYLNISYLEGNVTWSCTATNIMTLPNKTTIYGKTSAKLEIHIFYPSKVEMFNVIGLNEGQLMEITENKTVGFNCSVERHHESEIVLFFKEKELRRNVSTKTLIHSHRVTSCMDSGVYKCEAKNKYNIKPSFKKLNLTVRCTPLISPYFDLKTNVSCAQHAMITFQFKAIAYPTPSFQWFKLSGSSWNILKTSNKYKIQSFDNFSLLTVRDITDDDYGHYKLKIKNDVGSLEQSYFLGANGKYSKTEKSTFDLMFVIYSCGGVIIIVAVFVAIWFSRKRWLKLRHAVNAIYQNVPGIALETNNIYQNLPFSALAALTKDQPTRKEVVNEYRDITEKPKEYTVSQNEEALELNETFSEATECYNAMEVIKRIEKIKITEIYDFVWGRTDASFSVDFQKIPTGFQMPCSFARKPENIALNRFKGILPYDHTRVCFDGPPDIFINASYIDGYKRPKAYIACLGPTAATHDNFKIFWKMVWHEKSEVIVMVTNLNESSGMKCEQYWPDASQNEMYDEILVSCQKIEIFAEYKIRSLEVSKTTNTGKVCRRVVHLHYTAWPDKKTPEDVTSILEFRQIFHDIRMTVDGPVIVHCSAGIGRTGAFIAIDKLILEGKNEGSLNVVACITKMREQRVKMVQTFEQYKFIFQALAYALNFDCGPITTETLKDHTCVFDDGFFYRQYKELELPLERESKEQVDSRAKNKSHQDKNRRGADIPDNTNRVYLYLNRSYEDSDYINAVFINSYICKDHFIMAQSPLPGTESDFLTMIYQENCFCVVSMEDFNDHGMKLGKYLLKEKQSLDIGSFIVSCVIYDSRLQYTVRKVTIRNKDEFSTGERDFYHFQYNTWTAENNIPEKAEEFVEFLTDVQEYAILRDENSHVLVHCLKANERSGLFCAIAIIREKLLFDEQVSVLNTLRHLRTRRPSVITSMEQLKFCYKAAGIIAQKQNEGIYLNN